MAYSYTVPPTAQNLLDFLAASGVTPAVLTVSDDLTQLYIDAVVADFQRKTQRTFVPGSAGEIRYYDGSGTGLLEIDEYIDITAVSYYLVPAQSAVNITEWVEMERKPFPKTMLQVYRGQSQVVRGYITRFPEGRSNIQVTGQFGYGATIPKDVFLAWLQGAAAQILNAEGLTSIGKLEEWREADVAEKYGDKLASEAAGWMSSYSQKVKDYKRSASQALRKARPSLW